MCTYCPPGVRAGFCDDLIPEKVEPRCSTCRGEGDVPTADPETGVTYRRCPSCDGSGVTR